MKTVFASLFLFAGISVNAGTCNFVSGSFETTTKECQYSHDGVNFFNEGYKDINIIYNEQNKELTVVMDVSHGPYTLTYVTDGKMQAGRPMFEGESYVAECENNHIRIRAEMSALKYPIVFEYKAEADGKLIYQQKFEGGNFIRNCEMHRVIKTR